MESTTCQKFIKPGGGRGKPAKDSHCANCEIVWHQHWPRSSASAGVFRAKVQAVVKPKKEKSLRPVKRVPRPKIQPTIKPVLDQDTAQDGSIIVRKPEKPQRSCEGCRPLPADQYCAPCIERSERAWAIIERVGKEQEARRKKRNLLPDSEHEILSDSWIADTN